MSSFTNPVAEFRRPWLLAVERESGRRGAWCYVCELGGEWWNPNRQHRFIHTHARCGLTAAYHGVSDVAGCRPLFDDERSKAL